MTNAIVVGALVIYGDVFNVSNYDISTAATMLLAIVGFMILYQISKPMDPMRWGIWGFSVAGFIFCLVFLKDLFAITGMSSRCILLFVVFSVVTEPLFRYLTQLVKKSRSLYLKLRHRPEE